MKNSDWMVMSKPGGPLFAINRKRGVAVQATGSTIAQVQVDPDGKSGALIWGMSLLGHTQVKNTKGGTAPPTNRLAEFVLDMCGLVEYRKAKPKKYPKKA